jgi:hypothetical protein
VKKWLLLGVVVILMASVGCRGTTSIPASKDAKSTLEAWLAAAKSLESLQEDYKGTIDMATKGATQSTVITMEGQLHTKGSERLDEVTITTGTTKQEIKQYLFQDKVFIATLVNGQWTAREATPSIYFSDKETQAEFESLLGNNALLSVAKVERRLVSGEECDEVKFSADLAKFSREDKKFLLYSSGLSTIPDVDAYVDAIKSFDIRLCLLPSGVALESEVILELNPDVVPSNGIVSARIVTTVTHYEINPAILDSFFNLPS